MLITVSIPSISSEVAFAALSVFVAWTIYRTTIISERKRILNLISVFTKVTGKWFSSEYDDNSENKSWYHPNNSVYPVNTTAISSIITSNLLPERLLEYLTLFIQMVDRFNYRVKSAQDYINSNPQYLGKAIMHFEESLGGRKFKDASLEQILDIVNEMEDKDLKFYLKHLYVLQKQIHSDGIGKGNIDDDIPSLSKCQKEIGLLLKLEQIKPFGILKGGWRWLFADTAFLLLPFLIVLLYLLQFSSTHIIFS